MIFSKRRFLALAAALTILFGLWTTASTSGKIEKTALRNLHDMGFKEVQIGHGDFSLGGATLHEIKLDKDGFSTIKDLTLKSGLFSSRYDAISIDGLALSGDFGMDTGFAITGWTPQAHSALSAVPAFSTLLLKNGRIDLDTKQGSIRLEADGRTTCKDDAQVCTTDARLWGKQNQLVLDSRWKIVTSGQGWSTESEIMDARINIDRLSASRISGWLSFEKAGKTPTLPTVSGQIVAGQLRFGDHTSFSNISVTIEQSSHIVIQNQPGQNGGVGITADLKLDKSTPMVEASLTAATADALLEFLENIEKDTSFIPLQPAVLTALMLTPGNLNRIEKALSGHDYESVELVISGSIYDLGGKIITKRTSGDTMQQQVISLNPSEAGETVN